MLSLKREDLYQEGINFVKERYGVRDMAGFYAQYYVEGCLSASIEAVIAIMECSGYDIESAMMLLDYSLDSVDVVRDGVEKHGPIDYEYRKDTSGRFDRKKLALRIYELGEYSVAQCAYFAQMPLEDFIKFLGENGLSIFHYDSELEFVDELDNA